MQEFQGNQDIKLNSDENVLEVLASIESADDDTWYIKVMNRDTKEIAICKSIEEYSNFLNNAANSSNKEHFKATWLPSKAKPEHINEVREELFKFYEKFEDMG